MEKNMAPKWMEGHYILDIEGNKVTITDSKTLYSYTARCHPDDKFTIEDGIAEVFQKKFDDEMKIKIGDKVKTLSTCNYNLYAQWVDRNVKGTDKCRFAYGQPTMSYNTYKVLAIAPHGEIPNTDLAYIQRWGGSNGECYLVDVDALEKVRA